MTFLADVASYFSTSPTNNFHQLNNPEIFLIEDSVSFTELKCCECRFMFFSRKTNEFCDKNRPCPKWNRHNLPPNPHFL